MPNWCENKLIITGPKEDRIKFQTQAKGTHRDSTGKEYQDALLLDKFVPVPEALRNTIASSPRNTNQELVKQYGFDNWYDWCIANWGIKWDVFADQTDHTDRNLKYFFDSAWGPPDIWILKVAKMFPRLKFILHYNEPGMGFAGTITAKNEEWTDQERKPKY